MFSCLKGSLSPWSACRVLFKQRDNRFYPPSAWSLALCLVRIPFQLVEAAIYACIVYFWVGEALASPAIRKSFLRCSSCSCVLRWYFVLLQEFST